MRTLIAIAIGAVISSTTLSKIVGGAALLQASSLWISWVILCAVITFMVRAVMEPAKDPEPKRTRQFKTYKFTERIIEEPIGGDMVELKTVLESAVEFSEEAAPCKIYNMKGGRIA